MTTTKGHSPDLKELGIRLLRLSYQDMTTFAELLAQQIGDGEQQNTATALPYALLEAAALLSLPPAQPPIPHWATPGRTSRQSIDQNLAGGHA